MLTRLLNKCLLCFCCFPLVFVSMKNNISNLTCSCNSLAHSVSNYYYYISLSLSLSAYSLSLALLPSPCLPLSLSPSLFLCLLSGVWGAGVSVCVPHCFVLRSEVNQPLSTLQLPTQPRTASSSSSSPQPPSPPFSPSSLPRFVKLRTASSSSLPPTAPQPHCSCALITRPQYSHDNMTQSSLENRVTIRTVKI